MDALIDSHTFVWLVTDPALLSPAARAYLADPNRRLGLSVASGWELAIKHGLGKLPLSVPLRELLVAAPARALGEWVDIIPPHMLRVGELPLRHRDPFERLIVAQRWSRASRSSAPTPPWTPTASAGSGDSTARPFW